MTRSRPEQTYDEPQSGNALARQKLKDAFEDSSAQLLSTTLEVLRSVLAEGSPKEKLTAAKLVLNVQGLLDKRQAIDTNSVQRLIDLLMERRPVTYTELPSKALPAGSEAVPRGS